MRSFTRMSEAAEWALKHLGRSVVMATPLGLGKPNPLINAIYARVKADPQRELRIFTALSLSRPSSSSLLEKRFADPFLERQFGANYPDLEYVKDLDRGTLPPNIKIHEFYLQAGKALQHAEVQREYISLNYTHVQYAIADQGVNLLVQMVAKRPGREGYYSLSCNPDLTLDVIDLYKERGLKMLKIAVVHPSLPYCGQDAEVEESFFDAVVESSEMNHELFALPRQPIAAADFMIGLQASLLVEDGGTLQIGIGSLSEALVYSMILRQTQNARYREIANRLLQARPIPRKTEKFHLDNFNVGLYGTSEMLMDGFMHLRRAGILKREVFDLSRDIRCYLHGAFFLGSKEFYAWLRELEAEKNPGLCMTRVSKVNDLYDPDELALRRQRVKARFFNTCMATTLLGGASSDTLENGLVVSGVGGQYNFVAMSHELPDAFSALMFRATRMAKGKARSNVVWGQGHLTIPRHLRDVTISEYGLGFLRNRADEEVIRTQLTLADSRFQAELQETAIGYGKLSRAWRLPEWAKQNHPGWAEEFLSDYKKEGLFPKFPFGSDFTSTEEKLLGALTKLKHALHSKSELVTFLWRGLRVSAEPHREELERMQLWQPRTTVERFYRYLLLGAL